MHKSATLFAENLAYAASPQIILLCIRLDILYVMAGDLVRLPYYYRTRKSATDIRELRYNFSSVHALCIFLRESYLQMHYNGACFCFRISCYSIVILFSSWIDNIQ